MGNLRQDMVSAEADSLGKRELIWGIGMWGLWGMRLFMTESKWDHWIYTIGTDFSHVEISPGRLSSVL